MKKYSLPIKLLISTMILAVLAINMNGQALSDIFLHINATTWAMALGMLLLQIFALSIRWADLVNLHEKKISYGASYRITVASQLANVLLITSIGGVVVRIALAAQSGIDMIRAICASVTDRFMTLLALVLLAAIVLPRFDRFHDNAALAVTLPALIAGFAFAAIIALPLLKKIMNGLRKSAKFESCISYLQQLAANKMLTARLVVLSLATQICYFTAVYFICLSVDANLQFSALLVVLPVITLIASLPLSIGGWGIREGAFVYGLGLLGVPMESAFLISVQIGVISILAAIVSGIPALLHGETRLALWKKKSEA